jgi:hypothetical protein
MHETVRFFLQQQHISGNDAAEYRSRQVFGEIEWVQLLPECGKVSSA